MFERSARLSTLEPRVLHGFSLRGLSEADGDRPAFAGLNLAAKTGDDPARVAANLARLAESAGFDPDRLVRVRQVHGPRAVWADRAEGVAADAVCAHAEMGPVVVGVHTADCVPVLLASADGRVVAAVHAGWRGLVAGVIPAAVALLAGTGRAPRTFLAAVGPCIGPEAFEVGEEVAARFPAAVVVRRPGGSRPHVDLAAAARLQLLGCGLLSANIDRVGGCTHADPRRYFSYRRDGPRMGQHLSFVGFRPAS